jgi:hypothetical protein
MHSGLHCLAMRGTELQLEMWQRPIPSSLINGFLTSNWGIRSIEIHPMTWNFDGYLIDNDREDPSVDSRGARVQSGVMSVARLENPDSMLRHQLRPGDITASTDNTIPLPQVYVINITTSNVIGTPYICISFVPGQMLVTAWLDITLLTPLKN